VRQPLRITLLWMGGVTSLVVLRLIWGAVADAHLARELAAITGEPTTPAELFTAPSGDDPDDAVPLLMAATNGLNLNVDSPS
jgi:hypothetical protein